MKKGDEDEDGHGREGRMRMARILRKGWKWKGREDEDDNREGGKYIFRWKGKVRKG